MHQSEEMPDSGANRLRLRRLTALTIVAGALALTLFGLSVAYEKKVRDLRVRAEEARIERAAEMGHSRDMPLSYPGVPDRSLFIHPSSDRVLAFRSMLTKTAEMAREIQADNERIKMEAEQYQRVLEPIYEERWAYEEAQLAGEPFIRRADLYAGQAVSAKKVSGVSAIAFVILVAWRVVTGWPRKLRYVVPSPDAKSRATRDS